MRYISTRGRAPVLPFDEVLLTGLARDGGLYLPESWPSFGREEMRALARLPYQDLAVRVMAPFVTGSLTESELADLVRAAYAGFVHPAVAPLKQIGPKDWLLELFHGPTLAFKDYAMQVLGQLFDHVLTRRGQRVTIVGATSGDTGSAAIEAFRDRAAVDIFILFPEGRVSEVQRRQMTTVPAGNVHAVAVKGTFDDCQDLVKAMFNDAAFRDRHALSAVNSINWARVMAQIVYYFAAGLNLGAPDREIAFSVPTGNFGNVYAGWAARAMGLPVARFVVGSNRNDILTRFFDANDMSIAGVAPTISPSMDIQVSSNFERLLFELYGRDGAAVERLMRDFRESGRLAVDAGRWNAARADFAGCRLDDAQTKEAIHAVYQETGELLDPHSAIGVAAGRARRNDPGVPMVALATAHPAKFPDAVEAASGRRPGLPSHMANLFERPERFTVLPNELGAVQAHIAARLGAAAGV